MLNSKKQFRLQIINLLLGSLLCLPAIAQVIQKQESQSGALSVPDLPFAQEFHDGYNIGTNLLDNQVRGIVSDKLGNIWIATASGVFRKQPQARNWEPIITGEDRGPAYSVIANENGDVLLGTWDGIYRFSHAKLTKEEGVEAPISKICKDGNGNYALGPNGIWRYLSGKWVKQNLKVARTVRDAITDASGNLWVATQNGLYRFTNGKSRLFQDVSELISCYARAVSVDHQGNVWAGAMGGVTILHDDKLLKNLTTQEGIPSVHINCIRQSPNGTMWVGTNMGVVRYAKDWSHSLRFTKRWLTDNKVNDITFDQEGNAWIATDKGVSKILARQMTLSDKADEFYHHLMTKNMREPWICGSLRLDIPGDTASWQHSDDDNDGEYTSGYLVMESFRYAVTKDPDAKRKARKAFDFLKSLQTITGTEGFFARSIVPSNWTEVNDINKTYTKKEIAEELVADPRFKPVEIRWHKTADGKWLWKNDTSPDEMDGHMMGYFFFYELAANAEEKVLIRNHVKKIMDQLIKTNYNLVDVDGTHTHWGVWSPDKLNRDPDWASERSINSFELLAYLKFAFHLTDDQKYEKEYRRLIKDEGYLENVSRLNKKNPAWQIYFDRTLEGYLFPILLRYERDPKLKLFYNQLIEEWMAIQPSGENLMNNLNYAFATGKKINVPQTIEFLKDTPLDLLDWPIDHTLREDVQVVRSPILEEVQIAELPPASERATVRWDRNPWSAIQGDLKKVREPVFWLCPYWMARYLEIIQKP
jgi:streptogramin lyase